MSELEQVAEMAGGDFTISSDERGCRVSGSFGELTHIGDFDLVLGGRDVSDTVRNWLTAARAVQAAFQDGPPVEPCPPGEDCDADAEGGE